MTPESSLRADIVEVGRRMYAREMTDANAGNISVRLGSDRLLMTPKNVCKGFMTPDMMCVTDLEGRKGPLALRRVSGARRVLGGGGDGAVSPGGL